MIIITGAEGFIGSCLVAGLNASGYHDLVLVDDFGMPERDLNLTNKSFNTKVPRTELAQWIDENHRLIQFIFHIGARTDTTESDEAVLKELNLDYSKMLWLKAVKWGLPLVYASSAATYGNGELGYDDIDNTLPQRLMPLNLYGKSKNDFDQWALAQEQQPYFWAGLKFFNVYGPNEYHKGRMASVVFHAYNQLQQSGVVKLFKSHHPDYKDGGQLRDFVYVKDLVNVCIFLMEHRKNSGLYNLGSGRARTFNDLINAIFTALHKPLHIEYIDTPLDIRDKYQYFTEAKMKKLRSIGYHHPFTSIEDGVMDYVTNYLVPHKRI
ncbi:MAG: ADP-glyceromanno-heptose 6-epimerase [Bacteroidetes bacterium]|nr:MAG: ADP-glyceromanno-heptose 6-epimerase [Bacteroidota bacterium]